MSEVKDEVKQENSFKEENLIYLVRDGVSSRCIFVVEKPERVTLVLENGTYMYMIDGEIREYRIGKNNNHLADRTTPNLFFGVFDRTLTQHLNNALNEVLRVRFEINLMIEEHGIMLSSIPEDGGRGPSGGRF